MKFKINPSGGNGLMAAIAKSTGNKIKKRKLILPENIGNGYIQFFDLGDLIKLSIHQYELKQDVTLNINGVKTGKDIITLSFRNLFQERNKESNAISKVVLKTKLLPSVLLSSGDIDLEIYTPAKTKINTIIISVHVDLLKDLFNLKVKNTLLQNIVSKSQPYLYEEIISPEMQEVATNIVLANVSEQLSNFYFKLKAQELIYLFFVELLKRQNIASYPFNVSDVKMMYSIRDKIIFDLSVPPNLSELTSFSNMSESKMNRLFKQIFGNSIYTYYQALRMNEAAHLIREQNLSVSEVGYRLGFSNLSHFTRLFEKHIGLKPKKFSLS
jgi:AraC-like DNA-binding protein